MRIGSKIFFAFLGSTWGDGQTGILRFTVETFVYKFSIYYLITFGKSGRSVASMHQIKCSHIAYFGMVLHMVLRSWTAYQRGYVKPKRN